MIYETAVIAGKGRGRELGFPTINLVVPENFDAKEGIYGCNIVIDETTYKGALHWGPIPVFKHQQNSLEIFVLDWPATNQPTTVSFKLLKYLRPIQNFPTVEALKNQIAKDVSLISVSSAS